MIATQHSKVGGGTGSQFIERRCAFPTDFPEKRQTKNFSEAN